MTILASSAPEAPTAALAISLEVIHAYPDLTVHLTLFHASIAEGTPRKLEHQDIRWIRAAEIPQYRFCPADEAILERLRGVAGCGGPTQVGR